MTTDNKPPDEFINEFCDRLKRLLDSSPLAGLCATGKDGKENLLAIGEALLGRMNVASRTDFQEQTAILAQAVEKLARIEERLAQLESTEQQSRQKSEKE